MAGFPAGLFEKCWSSDRSLLDRLLYTLTENWPVSVELADFCTVCTQQYVVDIREWKWLSSLAKDWAGLTTLCPHKILCVVSPQHGIIAECIFATSTSISLYLQGL